MASPGSTAYPVRIADGGGLFTSFSSENIPEAGFTRILNLRRFQDQLIRREGWQVFVGDTQAVFDDTDTVLRLAQLVRPNGDKAIVGASRTKIKRYNSGTGVWDTIGSGYSADGKRWQAVTLNGYLILNNGVDLPVSFRVEDDTVTPLYELREIGYASVGRICEYNGFLMVGDVSKIKADQLDTFMNGWENYTVASTSAKNADFTVAFSGDFQKEFDVTTGSSDIAVTLPTMAFDSQPFYFWLKKADAGSGSIFTTPAIADEAIDLTTQNDKALVWWNGSAWVAKVFAGGTIPTTTPYGIPPADIVERYPWLVANGEFGDPVKWAPAFSALMAAASTTIYLPFVPTTWVAGQTRVGVINGGPSGATLGGQVGYDDGVLVTTIGAFDPDHMGVPVTLEVTTDTGLQYPRNVTVTRWTDISTLVSEYSLTGDGSPIVGMAPLGQYLIIYRTTCIYRGRYTGDATDPFSFIPMYPGQGGLNLPIWGDAIADVNGDFHLYPGTGGRFYLFDGVSWPRIHQTCDNARELFFTGVQVSDEVFVVGNPMTKEFWFCRPTLTFAYDAEFDTVSEIDAAFGAAGFVNKPGSTDQWFILAIGNTVYLYALVTNAATNIKSWLRADVVPGFRLKSGLIAARNFTDEKTLVSYTPVLASPSPDAAITVQLYSTPNPSFPVTALLDPVESLPTPQGQAYFTTWFQEIFFQDEIVGVTTDDIDFRISQRVFEFVGVGSARGVTRSVR